MGFFGFRRPDPGPTSHESGLTRARRALILFHPARIFVRGCPKVRVRVWNWSIWSDSWRVSESALSSVNNEPNEYTYKTAYKLQQRRILLNSPDRASNFDKL